MGPASGLPSIWRGTCGPALGKTLCSLPFPVASQFSGTASVANLLFKIRSRLSPFRGSVFSSQWAPPLTEHAPHYWNPDFFLWLLPFHHSSGKGPFIPSGPWVKPTLEHLSTRCADSAASGSHALAQVRLIEKETCLKKLTCRCSAEPLTP